MPDHRSKGGLWWPSDGSDEWLSRIDGLLSLFLLQNANTATSPSQKCFLEIGVWKGAFSATLLKNVADVRGYGIDPFPGRPDSIEFLDDRFRELQISSRWILYSSWSGFNRGNHGLMDLIHIDGEHSEKAATRDLEFSASALSESGILVVDDYRHFWFPGVASAMYAFVSNTDFRILAMTEKKAYLVRRPFHKEMTARMEVEIEREVGMKAFRTIDDLGLDFGFRQAPDVQGEGLLLIREG